MKKLLSFFLIIIFSVMAFELFLRYSPFSYGITPMEYDKDIGMWHKKSFSSFILKECYNTQYFFDQEGKIKNNYIYDSQKKDIVLLGDSQIEALMVPNDKVIHNKLYEKLEGKYNFLNYGLSGTGPVQQLQVLKTKVNLNNTKSIIQFIFLENDINDGDSNNIDGTNRPKVYMNFETLDKFTIVNPALYSLKEQLRDFLGKFELYVYLKKSFYFYKKLFFSFFNHTTISKEIIVDNTKNLVFEKKWKNFTGAIYQTNSIANQFDIDYKVIFISSNELKNNDIELRNKFKKFLTKYNINSINLVPFLNKLNKTMDLEFNCDGHWNEKAHNQIAIYLSIYGGYND